MTTAASHLTYANEQLSLLADRLAVAAAASQKMPADESRAETLLCLCCELDDELRAVETGLIAALLGAIEQGEADNGAN